MYVGGRGKQDRMSVLADRSKPERRVRCYVISWSPVDLTTRAHSQHAQVHLVPLRSG